MRPKPFPIPPGTPIIKCPDGKAQGTSVHQFDRPPTGVSKPKPRKLFRVTVECTNCHFSNQLMLTKRQLQHFRAKCEQCNEPIDLKWSGVRGNP